MGAVAHRNMPIDPVKLGVPLLLKRVGLVVRQATLTPNSSRPDISALAICPSVAHKSTPLALWHWDAVRMRFLVFPLLGVVDGHGSLEEVLDQREAGALADGDGVLYVPAFSD